MLRSYPRQGSAPEFGQTAPEKIQSTQERLQVPLVSGGKDLLGTPAAYPPVQLRLHPVFTQLGLVGTLINRTVYGRRPPEAVPEPMRLSAQSIN
jgi:hypothetical protein